MDWRFAASTLIIMFTLIGVAAGRYPRLKMNRATIALVGGVALIAVGALTLDDAYAALDLNTLALLFAMMVLMALWKPAFMEAVNVFPRASSSLNRSNMITLASTAIPIPRMIPAMPGNVSCILKSTSTSTIRKMYTVNATQATNPGRR